MHFSQSTASFGLLVLMNWLKTRFSKYDINLFHLISLATFSLFFVRCYSLSKLHQITTAHESLQSKIVQKCVPVEQLHIPTGSSIMSLPLYLSLYNFELYFILYRGFLMMLFYPSEHDCKFNVCKFVCGLFWLNVLTYMCWAWLFIFCQDGLWNKLYFYISRCYKYIMLVFAILWKCLLSNSKTELGPYIWYYAFDKCLLKNVGFVLVFLETN